MKTRAAILEQLRAPLVLDEVEIPALDYGQVLVKLRATRICGSQIGEIDGVKGPDRFLPHLLGHEACAEVLELGPGVTHVKPGNRVCLHWRPGLGIQAAPPTYRRGAQKVNAGWIATFTDYAVVSENRMTVVPDYVDDEVVCLLADTLTTGFGLVNKDAGIQLGESVVVVGCGGIGLGVILGAHLVGAHPIVAVDLHDHKLTKAREFGATHTINAADSDFAAEVETLLGEKPDVAIDGTGQPAVIEKLYELAKPRTGRTVLFGVMAHDKRVQLHTLPLHFGKILTGSEGGQSLPAVEIPRYCRMLRDGRFDPRNFISHRGRLDDVNELVAKMRAGEVIHSILHFGP